MTVSPRQSFRLKLCLWILSVSVFSFALVFAACLYFSITEMGKAVDDSINSKLDYAERALTQGLERTKVSGENLVSIISQPMIANNPENIAELSEFFLDSNPRIQGVAIGYEPGIVKGHMDGFSPYTMRTAEGFIVRDLAKEKDYRSADWYATPAKALEPRWSKPFRESNGTLITSYNIPFFTEEGALKGIAAVDLNLNVISDSLQLLCKYPRGSMMLLDRDGVCLAHKDRSRIQEDFSEDPMIARVLASTAKNEVDKSGKEPVYYVHKTEPETGWTIIMEVPHKDISAGIDKMLKVMLGDIILGIILLVLASYIVITRLTKPLESFAKAAQEISHGDFHVDLPVITEHNELYDLRQALCSMEVSLDDHIKRLEETSNRKASMERELSIARNIQMAMLPKIFPAFPNRTDLDVYASLTPAQAVGGDLYDFMLCDDTLFFCIGDVSGKGVPASLFMAITRSLFRNTAEVGKTPAEIARRINDAISDGNDMSMFVTMFIGSCELNTGEFKFCCCGHNAPVTNGVVIDPKTMTIGPGEGMHLMHNVPVNIPIGVLPGFDYKEVTMNIKPGITLMLYTDGVTEAENTSKELYGDDRMVKLLSGIDALSSSQEYIDTLIGDVHTFVGDAPQSDDLTALCFRYKCQKKDC